MLKQAYNCMRFGDKIIDQSQIFYQRKNVFGFVNIKYKKYFLSFIMKKCNNNLKIITYILSKFIFYT